MKRDCVCLLRILVDSIPKFIRNSKILFKFSKLIFDIPESLFSFREKYNKGEIKDLSIFYSEHKKIALKRISKDTDINSFHLRIIKKYFKSIVPKSLLDAGCGSGYLLELFKKLNPSTNLVGIDYVYPLLKDSKIKVIEGDILNTLNGFIENSFEFVICAHVIEHLSNADKVVMELRRVCSKVLIIICPIEKQLKWGMNYHINFFESKNSFINFINNTKSNDPNNNNNYKSYYLLGDLMYIEYIN